MDIKPLLRERVRDILKRKGLPSEITDRTPLITSGWLDSINVVEIAVLLEAELKVDFVEFGFDQFDFDSIDSMAAKVTLIRGSSTVRPGRS